jgi:endoglucanase
MKMRMYKKRISLVLAVMLLTATTLISGCGKKDIDADAEAVTDTATENTVQEDETETEELAQTQGTALYDVIFEAANSWGEEGGYGATYNVAFTNNSDSEVTEWYIEAEVPEGSSVSEAWGCEVKLEASSITITAVDWGAAVAAGQKIEVGFNMNYPSSFTPEIRTLYVNGAKVDQNTTVVAENTEESTQTTAASKPVTESGTPLENHGRLSVDGTQLVDAKGTPYQLKGVSTHGLSWFPEYVNKDSFQTIRDDWGGNVVRLAMYTSESGGYCSGGDQTQLKKLVDDGVNYATELGMYVIIDWHILNDSDPLTNQGEAEKFFKEVSAKYANYDNVLYEICNEPNGGSTWSGNIRPYAESIIPIIRANDKDAIIIIGTPTWSQDVDVVADDWVENPIPNAGNVMFAVHFYAATHTDNIRNKVTYALDKGLPVFVSEFSICDASGNGANDYNQAEKWFDLINDKNLSYCSWSLSNKAETSALISSGCSKTSGWTEDDLSDTGKWIRSQMRGE